MSIISKSLIRSLSIYSLGNIINAAVPFLLLPFLTNYLSKEDYGIIAMFQVIMSFLNPISGVSLQGAITRKYFFIKDKPEKFSRYVSTGTLFITLISALLLVIMILLKEQLSSITEFPAEWIWVILVCSFTHNIIEVLLAIWRVKLKAGKYGFFVIPNQEEWTIIFNSNWNQHGKDDDTENDDVLRFKVTPKVSEEIKEHLEYTVNKSSDTSGTIKMSWEKVTIEFPFEVK